MTLPPQARHGGVELPIAVRLHGGGGGREVALRPGQSSSIRAATFPGQAPRRHLEGEVVVGDVDVARVVALVGIVLTSLPVPPGVRLVPVVGADRHGEQPQRAERQEETRARQYFHSGHLPRSMESPNSRRMLPPWPWLVVVPREITTALRAPRSRARAA